MPPTVEGEPAHSACLLALLIVTNWSIIWVLFASKVTVLTACDDGDDEAKADGPAEGGKSDGAALSAACGAID